MKTHILLVSDDDSNHYAMRTAHEPHGLGLRHVRLNLTDLDLVDPADFGLVIFLNLFNLTFPQRELIQSRFMSDKRTLLFTQATGLFNGNLITDPSELTGIRLARAPLPAAIHPGIDLRPSAHPIVTDISSSGMLSFQHDPSSHCCDAWYAADPYAYALGYYPGTVMTSFAHRRFDKWTSLWSGTAKMPAGYYRAVARFAGVTI